jgi:hypothetical protein
MVFFGFVVVNKLFFFILFEHKKFTFYRKNNKNITCDEQKKKLVDPDVIIPFFHIMASPCQRTQLLYY